MSDRQQRATLCGVRLADRLERSVVASAVGRSRELARLDALWNDSEPVVLFVHGLPGIGKTTLLKSWAARSRATGGTIAFVDGREVDPTPAGFSRAIAESLGLKEGDAQARLCGDAKVAVVVDHFAALRLVEAWVRDRWLPQLGSGVRVVLAAAAATPASWLHHAGWHALFETLELGPMERGPALELLESTGLPRDHADRIWSAVGGNPLGLRLASALPAEQLATVERAAVPQLLAELSRRYLDAMPDARSRELLQAASVARRVTQPILAALFRDDRAGDCMDSLARLPFVTARSDGLQIHDAVRTAVAETLRASDPSRYRGYRRAVWAVLEQELAAVTVSDLWRCTADLLYMLDNSAVRRSFFPPGIDTTSVGRARKEDFPAVRELAARYCTPNEQRVIEQWSMLAPNALQVAYVGSTAPSFRGFDLVLPGSELPRALISEDPQLRAWVADARAREGGVSAALFVRRSVVDVSDGALAAPAVAAMWLDIKRYYMRLRPKLRYVYAGVKGDEGREAMRLLGFRELGDMGEDMGADPLETRFLDMGAGSVEGWLAGLLERELGTIRPHLLDNTSREILLPGGRVALTELEARLLGVLLDAHGAVVTNDQLLERVWGHAAGATTSNVVQAVVRTTRKKLGPYSGALTTVRGVGYRFEPPAL